ncbi:MAG: penicillin-binding protein 2 [Anaerolineales bacterium]|jgi:cell division protein FtsI/penicillin-binding protein 2|nr:penicillin-binding protein 2 [Anaerolineales bacterium]
MRQQNNSRAKFLAVIFAIFGFVAIAQMLRIQYSPQAAALREQGDVYAGEYRTLYPERGQIYDRSGYLLAGNSTVYEVGVSLQDMRNPHSIALAMSAVLGLSYDEIFQYISNPPDGAVYLVLKDYVSSERAQELQATKKRLDEQYQTKGDATLAGLNFSAHLQRSYPEYELGSNVIGFVTREGRGYFGVEEKYDDLLAGVPVTVWVPQDPNRAIELPKAPKGTDLVLTIDREIQAAVEQILVEAVRETQSKSGTVIVMNPKNGEILAMVSTPQMDLNEFWTYTDTYQYASDFNRAVSTQYEPGSVIKILTMAAAIDSGVVAPGTTYLDMGYYEIGGGYIYNWDKGAWGVQDMTGCLQNSLNVCMARLASQMGTETYYTYMRRFGIGRPTGIDLAGEAVGRLKTPGDADWYEIDLATNSFGQGVAVTPLQMLTAASALANDGRMVYPHVLYGMVNNGNQYNTPTQIMGTPISPQTARTVSEMLAIGMERGESLAQVEGYRLAGKTGTAQIPTDSGYYSPDEINASFIGWGPVDNPQFMVYVWLEKPETDDWASFLATPVFKEVVEKLVVLMDIPPDVIRQQLAGPP